MSPAAGAGAIVLALVLLAYPVLFYGLQDQLGITWLGALLAVLALARLLAQRRLGAAWRAAAAGAIVVFVSAAAYFQSSALLKLYPVAVNGVLLCWGVHTLFHPPSAIERLVLRLRWPVSAAGQRYMRAVTAIWCGFFALNGSVAAFTALAAPTAVWAWYNGAVSYLLAGALFGAELVFRGFYRRRHAAVGQRAMPAPGARQP